jgi:Protein of unknown function (DUF4058)
MPSPFPGMDPYLETPEILPDFHDSVITYLREVLQANITSRFVASTSGMVSSFIRFS